MYASRTVCSRCASQLRSAQARTLGGAAWFASLSDAPDASPSTAAAAAARGHERDGGRGAGGHRRSFSQRPGFSRRKSPGSSEESAVALFNDVVKPASGGTSATNPQRSSLGEWQIAAKIKELAERNISTPEKLRIFQADIWPHLKQLRDPMPRHLFVSTNELLGKACNDIAKKGHTGNSVELAQLCSSIGQWHTDGRNQLVLNICHNLLHENQTPADCSALLRELVGLWKHISQLCRRSQQGEALRFALPSPNEVLRDIGRSSNAEDRRTTQMHPTTRALTAIFLQFYPDQARDLIPGLLATVAVLSDTRLTTPNIQKAMAPLLNLMAVALGNEGATESYVSSVFNDRVRFPRHKVSEIQSYVTAQWPSVTAMLSKRDAPWRRGLVSSDPAASRRLASLHKQLREAYIARNKGAVVSIWQDLQAGLEQHPNLAKQMQNDPEFLDFWIFVWCAMRRPARLQETLNLMQQIQVHPTVKTYTAMMHGWKICRDTDKIEALWDKLAGSGIKLDVVIWTERISGLIEAGKPQAGVRALAEMMALWKKAVQQNAEHTAVQPTIEAVNAAFKGLICLDRKAAYDVLEWAGREQIEPNIRTYNILLSESFRNDTTDDVQSLLRAMKNQGIEPDAATFTIILEEVLGTMSDASAAEQVQAVEQVLAEIEAAGLRPNLETYGKMLYAVASLANGADEAIAAVQTHMRGNGFSATPHMITILIERALSRDPPDITAVTAVLAEHGLTHVGQGDQTLWERVMSAHAITGGTARAMAVFNDLARAGRPVTSLSCLKDLLVALLDGRQWDEARGVVGVVLGYKTRAREGSRDPRYWRHHFWYLAKENGLLNWDELPEELRSGLRG